MSTNNNSLAHKQDIFDTLRMLFGYRNFKVFNNSLLHVDSGDIVLYLVDDKIFIYNVLNSGDINDIQTAISNNIIKQWVSNDTLFALNSVVDTKLDINTYNADKQTFTTIDNINSLLSDKANTTDLSNLATNNVVNKTFKDGRYDVGRKNIILTTVDGNEKNIDVSALSLPPIFSSIRFDNDSDELVFNDGRSDTRISLAKFLDYVETPEATADTSGKVALNTIDSKIDSKINTFKNGELSTLLSDKLSLSVYNTEKNNFLTVSTLEQKLNSKNYLTSNDISGKLNTADLDGILDRKNYITTSSLNSALSEKLDTSVYNSDKSTFATTSQLVQSATATTQGKVSLNEIDARIDTKIDELKSHNGIDSLINKIKSRRP